MTPGGVQATAYFSQKRHNTRAVITPHHLVSPPYLADDNLKWGRVSPTFKEACYVS